MATILDAMDPEVRARLEVWVLGTKALGSPHMEALRAIHDFARTQPNEQTLPHELAYAMAKIISALELLDLALVEARTELARVGITIERTN